MFVTAPLRPVISNQWNGAKKYAIGFQICKIWDSTRFIFYSIPDSILSNCRFAEFEILSDFFLTDSILSDSGFAESAFSQIPFYQIPFHQIPDFLNLRFYRIYFYQSPLYQIPDMLKVDSTRFRICSFAPFYFFSFRFWSFRFRHAVQALKSRTCLSFETAADATAYALLIAILTIILSLN
jgi:hypothetical protein